MPTYSYKARTRAGQLVAGSMQAENSGLVMQRLQATGYFPLGISEAVAAAGQARGMRARYTRVGAREIAILTRQLSDLLGAGLPLLRALNTLLKQTDSPAMHRLIEQLRDAVQGGSTLGDALAQHTRLFKPVYTGMVRAGEAGGVLEAALARLADFLEKDMELRSRIRSAMAYPLFMLVLGAATIIFLVSFVIPKLVGIISELAQTLPLPTLILVRTSGFLSGPGGLVVLGVALLVVLGLIETSKTAEGRATLDRLKLRLPVAGRLARRVVISRFARTLGTLIKSGVPILSALDMVKEVVGNTVFAAEIDRAIQGVREGGSLARQLERGHVCPPMVVDMIAVGEEAGTVDAALSRVADTYDREIENGVRAMVSLLEPVMILIMGAFVGLIVAAMILPIFQMSAGIGG